MKDNGSVTPREYLVANGAVLVSTTDLDGRITSCNDAFVIASGYAPGELIGRQHDEIDHPDMPAELLCMQWATLAAGAISTALIKSRRKNGDPYWVRSTMAPVLVARRSVGYFVVRTRPLRRQVEVAQAQYTALREGVKGSAAADVGA